MKTSIDKNFTHVSAVSTVKNAIKGFKSIYKDSDVLTAFNDECREDWNRIRGDVLEMTVTAYDNYECVSAMIEAVVFDRCTEFSTVRFHIDIDHDGYMLKVYNDPVLITVEKYRICR